jgi:hypothetical protein
MRIHRFFLIAVFSFLTTATYSQATSSLRAYLYQINKAELCIIRSDFRNALLFYDSAFNQDRFAFSYCKDYYNAAKAAYFCHNFTTTFKYLKNLSKFNINLREIKNDKDFATLTTNKAWPAFEMRYEKALKKYYKNINHGLLDSLKTWAARDQQVRKNGYDSQYLSAIDYADSMNIHNFFAAVKQYGFPTEYNTGKSSLEEQPLYFIFLLHNYQKVSMGYLSVQDVDTLIKPYVNNGMIHPYDYTALHDTKGRSSYLHTLLYRFDTSTADWYKSNLLKVPIEKTEEYNNNRSKIGLENIDQYLSKLVFSVKNNSFHFNFPFSKFTLHFNNKVDAERMKFNLLKIE